MRDTTQCISINLQPRKRSTSVRTRYGHTAGTAGSRGGIAALIGKRQRKDAYTELGRRGWRTASHEPALRKSVFSTLTTELTAERAVHRGSRDGRLPRSSEAGSRGRHDNYGGSERKRLPWAPDMGVQRALGGECDLPSSGSRGRQN